MPNHHISIPKVKYTRGCLMLYVKYYNLKFTQAWIPHNHIFNDHTNMYGLESEPHITLLSGILNGVSLKKIETSLIGMKFPQTINIDTKLSTFPPNSKKTSALKFDLIKDNTFLELADIHNRLKSIIPNEYQYDGFNPHLTIGFIKEQYRDFYDNPKLLSNNNIISHTIKSNQRNSNMGCQTVDSLYTVYTTPAGDKFIINNLNVV